MNQQTIFDQIEAPVRGRDPYSSQQAAARAAPRAGTQAREILEALALVDEATTRALQKALYRPSQPAWNKVPTRLLDLARRGLVRRQEQTRAEEGGQHFLVYEITAAGRDCLT